MNEPDRTPHCRFITSLGGAAHCMDAPYLLGFCQFHFECYERGEIEADGRFSDKLDDQERRRLINFHGVKLPDDLAPTS